MSGRLSYDSLFETVAFARWSADFGSSIVWAWPNKPLCLTLKWLAHVNDATVVVGSWISVIVLFVLTLASISGCPTLTTSYGIAKDFVVSLSCEIGLRMTLAWSVVLVTILLDLLLAKLRYVLDWLTSLLVVPTKAAIWKRASLDLTVGVSSVVLLRDVGCCTCELGLGELRVNLILRAVSVLIGDCALISEEVGLLVLIGAVVVSNWALVAFVRLLFQVCDLLLKQVVVTAVAVRLGHF